MKPRPKPQEITLTPSQEEGFQRFKEQMSISYAEQRAIAQNNLRAGIRANLNKTVNLNKK